MTSCTKKHRLNNFRRGLINILGLLCFILKIDDMLSIVNLKKIDACDNYLF